MTVSELMVPYSHQDKSLVGYYTNLRHIHYFTWLKVFWYRVIYTDNKWNDQQWPPACQRMVTRWTPGKRDPGL